MRDVPIRAPEGLGDLQGLGQRFATNPGGLDTALLAWRAWGWDVNAWMDGRPPLLDALQRRDLPLVRGLLRAGADPMRPSPGPAGGTLLHQAACWNEVAAVEAMLQVGGADVGSLDARGFSLLHLAVSNRSVDMVELLVEEGLDPWAPEPDGRTAMQQLMEQGQAGSAGADLLELAGRLPEMRAVALEKQLAQSLPAPAPAPARKPRL